MADRGVASDAHATTVMSTRRPPARLHSALVINLSFPPAFLILLHQGVGLGQRLEAVCYDAQVGSDLCQQGAEEWDHHC